MENKYKLDVNLLKQFLEITEDIFMICNNDGLIESFTDKTPELLGYDPKEISGKFVFSLLTKRAQDENNKKLNDLIGNRTIIEDTAEVLCGNGLIKYYDFTAVYKLDKIFIFAKDITKRIQLQVELETLSYRDSLTGLYNRNYFVEVIPSYKSEVNLPVAITIIDINDLKLINDAFGHSEGDHAIITLANVINNNIPKRGYAMRIGGDEFAVVVPNAKKADIDNMLVGMKKDLSKKTDKGINLSAACGTFLSDNLNVFDSAYNIADTRMYRSKQIMKEKNRLVILNNVMDRLFEMSPIDELISKGVKENCTVIGRKLGFNSSKVKEIGLLGYYQNIGKIILDNTWLNKTKIDKDMMDEYMLYANKSYSLFSSSKELFTLARDVSLIFENYDGSGKFEGLSNENIPIYSRILKLAISINKMEIDRLSSLEIRKYLEEQSGVLFDPYLVEQTKDLI